MSVTLSNKYESVQNGWRKWLSPNAAVLRHNRNQVVTLASDPQRLGQYANMPTSSVIIMRWKTANSYRPMISFPLVFSVYLKLWLSWVKPSLTLLWCSLLVCEPCEKVMQQLELNSRCALSLLTPCFVSCLCCHVPGGPGERLPRDQRLLTAAVAAA